METLTMIVITRDGRVVGERPLTMGLSLGDSY